MRGSDQITGRSPDPGDGAEAPARSDLTAVVRARVGRVLCNKYRIERVLGIGGVATVYAATHRNGRRVAVKLLHPELAMNREVSARFLREGLAANAVEHPGAVAVLDDDVAEDGAAFLVMELLDGKVVRRLWEERGERLQPGLVLAMARDLCGVLAAAHRAKIVHRDVKPANLFLTEGGLLKVLDFGLAQVRTEAKPVITLNGTVLGTPTFMAPEQAAGRTAEIDPRTDVWAVGATMFALLSGRTVHTGRSPQEVIARSATRPAPSLRAAMPDADPAIVALVDRALALAPADRWPSADAMREAICETIEALGVDPTLPAASAVDRDEGRSLRPSTQDVSPARPRASAALEPTQVLPGRRRGFFRGIREGRATSLALLVAIAGAFVALDIALIMLATRDRGVSDPPVTNAVTAPPPETSLVPPPPAPPPEPIATAAPPPEPTVSAVPPAPRRAPDPPRATNPTAPPQPPANPYDPGGGTPAHRPAARRSDVYAPPGIGR